MQSSALAKALNLFDNPTRRIRQSCQKPRCRYKTGTVTASASCPMPCDPVPHGLLLHRSMALANPALTGCASERVGWAA